MTRARSTDGLSKKAEGESANKKMYDTLVSIKKSFENKLYGKRPSYISDEGIIEMISRTLNSVKKEKHNEQA